MGQIESIEARSPPEAGMFLAAKSSVMRGYKILKGLVVPFGTSAGPDS